MGRSIWPMFPDVQQDLLLRTCLLDGEAAIASWHAWRARIGVEDLDLASQRLLPLAYQNLTRLGIVDPELARYKGVARHVWSGNRIRVRNVEQLLQAFAAAQIPVMVLKGIALLALYYRNWGSRATTDIDILVPPPLAAAAGRVLVEHGWTCTPQVRFLGSASYRTTCYGMPFWNDAGIELDLHWHVIRERCEEDADEGFWRHAQPVRINASEARTLGDTDQLFHAIVHGTQGNLVSPIRWIADAAMILRAAEIDWQRFLDQVVESNLVLRVRPALRYLHDAFGLPIPAATLDDIARIPHTPVETLEARFEDARLPRFVRQAGIRYAHYRRTANAAAAPSNFLTYLQTTWGSSTWIGTVKEGARRAVPYFRG